MYLLAKYGVQTSFSFPLEIRGAVDLAGQADYVPATGDVYISINGAAPVQATNLPSCGALPAKQWVLTLTAAELTGATIYVQLVDSSVKAVEDQILNIYTFGNAAAKIPFDLSNTTQSVNMIQALGQPLILNGTGGQKIGT
jgi:hypothetical protein